MKMQIPSIKATRLLLTLSALLFSVAAFAIASTAQAALLNLNYTGNFDATTTLGGVPLGADTPFSITATFQDGVLGTAYDFNLFEVTTLSLSLTGHGTYTAIPDSNLNVGLYVNADHTEYTVGLVDSGVSYTILSTFAGSSNPSFNFNSPTPTSFTGYIRDGGNKPYNISLAEVAGGLSVKGFGSPPVTASITAVPEPSTYAMALAGLACGGYSMFWRRKQA
jgi:hypothetical protein